MIRGRVLLWLIPLCALLLAACGQASPVSSGQASPVPSREASPVSSSQASPVPSLEASPVSSPEASPIPSREASPVPSGRASPVSSHQVSPVSSPEASPLFSGQEALQQAAAQLDLGPRPTGSEAGWATGDYILNRLEELGWETEVQETTFRGVKLRNLWAHAGSGPVVIVGAHYDTRPHADNDETDPNQWILGANDGASGVAVLLELARVLDRDSLSAEVWLTFFDAEDRGRLDGWPYSVGAAMMARQLEVTPQAVIVLDMVGDKDQRFLLEKNSDPALSGEIWDIGASLGYQEQFISEPMGGVIDDHLPFKQMGIPVVLVIDFTYPAWHTSDDTLDQISAESLERIGRVMEVYLEQTDF